MAVPTTITPAAAQVVLEIEDNVSGITSRQAGVWFGTVVLVGSGVTLYSVGDIVLAWNGATFNEGAYRYVVTADTNILLTYAPP